MTKGGPELFEDPIARELLASAIPARLAYTWTDGTPRVASLWFHWDGQELVMCTFRGAPKLKALKTDDRVAMTIDTQRAAEPHPFDPRQSGGHRGRGRGPGVRRSCHVRRLSN